MAKRKKPESEDSTSSSSQGGSDENFGLPDIEFKPLDRTEPAPGAPAEEPAAPAEQPVTAESEVSAAESFPPEQPKEPYRPTYTEPEPERSPVGMIITILLIIVLAGAGVWYFMMYKPKADQEKKQALELAEKRAADKRAAEEAERTRLAEEERLKREAEAAKPKEGSFQIVEERTGRYYVVIATAIDDDLLQDYAKKLGASGISLKMIPPFGKTRFYRLAIDDQDTWDAAQAKADGLKAQYGDAVWVLKY